MTIINKGRVTMQLHLAGSVCRGTASASVMMPSPAAVKIPPRARHEEEDAVKPLKNDARSRGTNINTKLMKPPTLFEVKKPTAFPLWVGLDVQPRDYEIITKSRIRRIFDKYAGPGVLDHHPYVAAASVLPMRTNNYVVEDLIDWRKVPHDPMFQLVFPQPDMLSPSDLQRSMDIIGAGMTGPRLREEMEAIRASLNPHPAGQKTLNVPLHAGKQVKGMQHKYREMILFFPTEAQYCHSFCTYCFRWAQFTAVGSSQQFASKDSQELKAYLRANMDVSDVLFTGGDPMVMNAHQLSTYVDPILQDHTLDHIATIRFGTKAVAYWPYRFITDPDADETLRLFQRVVESGRQVSIMAHFSHPNELSGPAPQEAIRRIRSTGANVRTQAPLINHVNPDPATWATMWRLQTRLGAIPYYMFVERDTGARKYFEVPLAKAYDIYIEASSATAGTVRTIRGPSMSSSPGKIQVVGVTTVAGEKVFVLRFLQARNPKWVKEVFFAKFDESATWLDDLRPAFGQSKFFFEDELAVLEKTSPDGQVSSGQMHPLSGPAVVPDVDAGININRADYIAARGRMCVNAGVGDMRLRNNVIPPRPLESGTSVQLFQQQ